MQTTADDPVWTSAKGVRTAGRRSIFGKIRRILAGGRPENLPGRSLALALAAGWPDEEGARGQSIALLCRALLLSLVLAGRSSSFFLTTGTLLCFPSSPRHPPYPSPLSRLLPLFPGFNMCVDSRPSARDGPGASRREPGRLTLRPPSTFSRPPCLPPPPPHPVDLTRPSRLATLTCCHAGPSMTPGLTSPSTVRRSCPSFRSISPHRGLTLICPSLRRPPEMRGLMGALLALALPGSESFD